MFPRKKKIFKRNDIIVGMSKHPTNNTTPPFFLPVVRKLKDVYIAWFGYYKHIPKIHRYTLGQKVDQYLCDSIEYAITASFLKPDEKVSYVRAALRKVDTVKVLLLVMWEIKSLDTKKYIHLSKQIDEIGKMLQGWYGSVSKK